MRLLDLEPRWLMQDGARVGFAFRCPTKPTEWQTCMVKHMKVSDQIDLWEANGFEDHCMLQPYNPGAIWAIGGGIDNADFATVSVTPSLDGSAGGLWHGHITNGEIVGGL